jgi:hypothetical protein
MDNNSYSYGFTSMYGVHGIDDNPRVHPFADLAKSCTSCTSNASCGDGMRCVRDKDGRRACLAECTATVGCKSGQTCRNVALDNTLTARVCAPEGNSCATPAPSPSRLLINEVMPAPRADYNQDGVASTTQDEYVEIVNAGGQVIDLTGYSLSDAYGVRHLFPSGTKLPPGGALVVFGGGAPKIVAGTAVIQTASTTALGLNDGGDSVSISDKDGVVVERTAWTTSLGADTSWARARDLDASAPFASAPPSCGTRRDGSQF